MRARSRAITLGRRLTAKARCQSRRPGCCRTTLGAASRRCVESSWSSSACSVCDKTVVRQTLCAHTQLLVEWGSGLLCSWA